MARSCTWTARFLSLAIVMVALCPLASADTRYVRTGGSDSNNGLTWANAYGTVTKALEELSENGAVTEIRVAQGTYYPHPSDPSISWSVERPVALKGGYLGTGGSPDTRDPAVYVTVLSGDLDDDDDAIPPDCDCGTNSYRLMELDPDIEDQVLIDGFTLYGAFGWDNESDAGAINVQDSSPSSPRALLTIRDCHIYGNLGEIETGAIRVEGWDLTIRDCLIEWNQTHGGTASLGGAVVFSGGAFLAANTTFASNAASGASGG